MFQHVPNIITASRLVLAVVFFVMLGVYQHDVSGRHGELLWLNIAFAVYLVALLTDFLDGYLARKWRVEGAFGRVVDPFVDKVLVLGSFIFFAGKNFTIPLHIEDPASLPTNVATITGVVPWMVVVILARELLVTSLRALVEASGDDFGAAWIGKFKMTCQSVTVLIVLVYVNYHTRLELTATENGLPQLAAWFRWFRNFAIWVTVLVTIVSGIQYVARAITLYRAGRMGKA
jgi:CDP-diacylglycerol--glycerol-3-phosphate 3-phosphatidyltransferase